MEDELYTNGDEELDRYYSASLIQKANFPVDKMDKSTLVRQYDEESKSDKLFMPIENGGYTSIGNAPPEMIQIPASGKQMALSIPKNRRGNGLQGYFDDLDSAVKKVTGPIITGAAEGVDRFTDTVSDFLGKYMKFKIDPVNLLGIPEINPKQIIMDSTGFDGIDVSMFEPDTKPGMMAKELISYVVGYSLTPGGPLGTAAKVAMKDAGAMMSEGPYIGNIFEIAKDLGLENEITSYLSASIENPNDATLDERLASRIKATTDIPLMAGVLYSAVKILGNKAFQLAAGGLTGTALTAQEAEGSPLGTFVRQTLKSMNRVDNLSQPGEVNQVDNTVYQRNDKGDLVPQPKIDPQDNIARIEAPTDKESGIIAFHGSGADFDKFSLNKIGTGEGNQAFGYGLYFTESEDIAKFYKDAMREKSTTGITKTVSYKGKNIDIDNIDTFEDSFAYANADISPEKTKEKLLKEKERLEKDIASNNEAIKRINSGEIYPSLIGNETLDASTFEKGNLYQQPRLDAVNNVLNNLSDLKVLDTAKTYKVALAPKPDELLDYDLPFSQQNKLVKERLSKVANEMTVDDAINLGFDPFDFGNNNQAAINAAKKEMLKDDQSVQAFLNNWQAFRGEQGAGEKLLNKHGIKGIKYLDNASRNTFGGKLLGINKLDDGQFQARIVLDDPNRQTGLGGSGRVITTSKPYKTQKEAEDWANKEMGNRQSNYVIFDENLINILAKYGIVGPVAVTALSKPEFTKNEQ